MGGYRNKQRKERYIVHQGQLRKRRTGTKDYQRAVRSRRGMLDVGHPHSWGEDSAGKEGVKRKGAREGGTTSRGSDGGGNGAEYSLGLQTKTGKKSRVHKNKKVYGQGSRGTYL